METPYVNQKVEFRSGAIGTIRKIYTESKWPKVLEYPILVQNDDSGGSLTVNREGYYQDENSPSPYDVIKFIKDEKES